VKRGDIKGKNQNASAWTASSAGSKPLDDGQSPEMGSAQNPNRITAPAGDPIKQAAARQLRLKSSAGRIVSGVCPAM
jgi:hypothetical protein